MKAGRLFEDALKEAQITLKAGSEMKVKVQGKGAKLHLVVRPSGISEFEASILERSAKASVEDLKAYTPKMPVGERIRTLRKAAGLTLDVVASRAEMTKGSLCSIEKGKRSVGLSVLKKISKALGVSVTVLVVEF
jgi:DNA-binding XRE family transcriptional regulator